MSDEHLNIVHLLATDRACQGQLIVRKRGDLVRQIKSVTMRPFGRWHLHCAFSEHALGRRIKDEKVAVLVSDDDGVAHVRQNRVEDFVDAREFRRVVGYSLFQFVPTCAQGLFQLPLLGNIGISPKPTNNSPFFISDRKRAGKEPSGTRRSCFEAETYLPRVGQWRRPP